MAYGTRFRARVQTIAGVDMEILIQKDGYSGYISDRPFGQVPVLKVDGDLVMSTSVEFALECQQEDDLVELYTSAATEYKVLYYYDGSLVFSGFITPELYAASWIDPPYDVRIVASDNFAELRGKEWMITGRIPLSAVFSNLLGATGTGLSLYWCSSLSVANGTAAGMPSSLFLSLEHLKGKTYYDVLTEVLRTLHARIVQISGRWCVFRETDLSGLIYGSYLRSNTSTNMCRVLSFGSAKSSSIWPVGHLTMEISPAHNSQRFIFEPNWFTGEMEKSVETATTTFTKDASNIGLTSSPSLKVKMNLTNTNTVNVYASIAFRDPNGYYLQGDGSWPYIGPTPEPYNHLISVPPSIDGKVIEMELPGRVLANPSFKTGNFSVIVNTGSNITANSATIECIDKWDLTEDVRLSNNARTPADEIELALLDVDYTSESPWISNAFSTSSSWSVLFKSAAISAGEQFRYFIARDYAFSHANPRLVLKGVLSTSEVMEPYSLIYANRGINYLVRSLSWDAYNEETDVELVSLPASALEVEDITFTKTRK